ncbi:MAG TPA: NADH-quinone oxidoreductase subunit J [Bacteroidales bacterium]|nr:NADH-quinone oxidoreductase subunit J [Bacteroidales bacterium]HSA44689.1 NADH-quinone oxidoreductase subunit J [Bacteroidales bacterium]
MELNEIMFVIFGAVIVFFSILTVTSRRILRAATFLLFVLVATAGLYFWLNYEFMAAVQVTLYAGGIVVLIIFSILLTSNINDRFEKVAGRKVIFSALAAIAGAILCITTILQQEFQATEALAREVNMNVIGRSLMNYGENGFVLPFEVISVLLLAAMISAIVIAKKSKSK